LSPLIANLLRIIQADNHVDVSKRSGSHLLNLPALISESLSSGKRLNIATLYRSGPGSVGSFDPTGSRSQMAYGLAMSAEQLKESVAGFKNATREFVEDMAKGKFLEAVKGREESRVKAFEKILLDAKKGDSLTKRLVPFHKFCLSISDEEESRIRVSLGYDVEK
jgi:hypothetical protein